MCYNEYSIYNECIPLKAVSLCYVFSSCMLQAAAQSHSSSEVLKMVVAYVNCPPPVYEMQVGALKQNLVWEKYLPYTTLLAYCILYSPQGVRNVQKKAKMPATCSCKMFHITQIHTMLGLCIIPRTLSLLPRPNS